VLDREEWAATERTLERSDAWVLVRRTDGAVVFSRR
jgi:hypothetical protein